jgi:hypothetical protein
VHAAAAANRMACPEILRSTRLIVSCGFEDGASGCSCWASALDLTRREHILAAPDLIHTVRVHILPSNVLRPSSSLLWLNQTELLCVRHLGYDTRTRREIERGAASLDSARRARDCIGGCRDCVVHGSYEKLVRIARL